MPNGKSRSSNKHLQTSIAEASELALLKELPEETKVIISVEELLQTLLSDDWFESSTFRQFIQKFQQVKKPFTGESASGITILLLDAENLKYKEY